MAVKDWLKKEAPNWAQSLPGGNRSKVPSAKVFTTALTKAPVLDKAKNIKSPGLRVVASLGEGFVNTPSNIVRSYGRTVNDIRGGAPIKRTIGDAGELALNMASFVPLSKGKVALDAGKRYLAGRAAIGDLMSQGFKQGAKLGAGYGFGYGAFGEAQNDESTLRSILQKGLESGALGGITGGVLGGGLPIAGAIPGALRNSLANRRPGAITREVIPPHYVPSNETAPFNLRTMRAYPKPGQRLAGTNFAGPNGTRVSPVDKLLPEQVVERGRKTPTVSDLLRQTREALPRPGMSIQAVDDPLLSEARKYNSPEELKPFIGNDGKITLYHGSNTAFDKSMADYGTFLTANRQEALDYARMRANGRGGSAKVSEIKLDPSEVRLNQSTGEFQYIGESKSLSGSKYPKEVYKAYNDVNGSNLTAKEIDNLSFDEVRGNASMGMENGREEFDQLIDLWKKAQGGKTLSDLGKEAIEALPRPGMSIQAVGGGRQPQKQRGFAETVSKSPITNKKVVSMLQDANYTPEKNDELVMRATAIVENDIDKATDIALNGGDNMSIATASELIKKFQNDGNFTAAANLTKEVAAKLTDAGRYVQAASLYNRLTPQGIIRYAQQELSKEGLNLTGEQAKVLTELSKKAGSLKGEEQVIATKQMLDKVQEFIPSKFADQLVTVWKAGLLTNPTTHIANVGGNTTMLGLETLKDYPATVLDAIASLATGKRTKTTPSYRAIGSGVVSGAKKAFTYAKTGVDVDETLGKIDYKKVNLPPVIKQYTEFVFRMLGATDKFFKETLLKKSLMEQAKVDGINRGLSGKALRDHANNLFQNPSIDMVKNATEEALYGTFNSRNALTEKLGNSAAVNVVAPFKRTPTNIGARILDYSPYGIGKGFVQGVKGNQKGFAENVARGAIGTGIGALGYGLGKAGQMTGNYPSNETERALWEAEGRQPGALKVGGSYYGLNRISPVGNILATGAGMADLGRIKPENVPGAMAAVAGKNLLGQTYLQGVSGALNALQDPNRSAATWVENLAKGVIPSIIGAGARAIDPYQRQVNSIGEAVQSRIPGLSQNLLPKVDAFGRKLQNESNPFFDPFNTKKDKSDQTTKEIWRLYKNYSGVSLGKPNESVSLGKGLKIDLTPEEFTAYQQRTGGVFKPLLDQVISSKDYRAMSDYDKAKTINNVISKVRQLWVIQNASSLENKGGLLQQIQEQVKLRTPAFYTR